MIEPDSSIVTMAMAQAPPTMEPLPAKAGHPHKERQNTMIEFVINYLKLRLGVEDGEKGAALVEYGLLVALIAVVCLLAVTAVGTGVRDTFNGIVGSL